MKLDSQSLAITSKDFFILFSPECHSFVCDLSTTFEVVLKRSKGDTAKAAAKAAAPCQVISFFI